MKVPIKLFTKSDIFRILKCDLSKSVIKISYSYVQEKETKIALLENNNNMVMSTSTTTDQIKETLVRCITFRGTGGGDCRKTVNKVYSKLCT